MDYLAPRLFLAESQEPKIYHVVLFVKLRGEDMSRSYSRKVYAPSVVVMPCSAKDATEKLNMPSDSSLKP